MHTADLGDECQGWCINTRYTVVLLLGVVNHPEKINCARLECTYPGGSVLHWKGQLGNSIWSGNFLSEQNPEGICLLLREKGGQDQCRNIQKLRCIEY